MPYDMAVLMRRYRSVVSINKVRGAMENVSYTVCKYMVRSPKIDG